MPLVKQSGMEVRGVTSTMWLDKKSGIDLQSTISMKMKTGGAETEMRAKYTKHDVKFDENSPNFLFTFSPPAVAGFDFPVMNFLQLDGKPAPAFSAAASDGRTYRVEELKGNVVLLDFWAARYAPCRNEIPLLDQIFREGKDRDLVVLGLDVGSDRGASEKLLREAHVSYPTDSRQRRYHRGVRSDGVSHACGDRARREDCRAADRRWRGGAAQVTGAGRCTAGYADNTGAVESRIGAGGWRAGLRSNAGPSRSCEACGPGCG